jgi:hypothetical protein
MGYTAQQEFCLAGGPTKKMMKGDLLAFRTEEFTTVEAASLGDSVWMVFAALSLFGQHAVCLTFGFYNTINCPKSQAKKLRSLEMTTPYFTSLLQFSLDK